ncbi:MAG: hypothetical protein K5634_00375 [Sphaerochaetaceae bacterium]|nr:hypothetical protein [Sphaerochaetaceae bacterium]
MITTQVKLEKTFENMILSASGWRKVFAASGDEEDFTTEITPEDSLICTAIGLVFGEYLEKLEGSEILLARDARPTGEAICGILYRTLTHMGCSVRYCGICSAPEIMAQSAVHPYKGFVYVSASHNPVGHNGIKGGAHGGVFAAEIASVLIEELKKKISSVSELEKVYLSCGNIEVSEDCSLKKQCLEDYRAFVLKTACPEGKTEDFIGKIRKAAIGIVGDLNGSARCLSIDKTFLPEMGFKCCFINDTASEIKHAIVPEGENLRPCRNMLEKMHEKDPSFVLGYTPDNDGDRGNLVYIDDDGQAKIIQAQEVFALCVYAVLRNAAKNGTQNLAVAVNGPTSMRIDELAARFGAKTMHAEVGEANVVNLGQSLRDQGYAVPILGEGSNGGNITWPARVRDPMNTIMSMASLIADGITIPQALRELPAYTTTSVFAPAAIIRLKTRNFSSLKASYEKNFPSFWEEKKAELEKYGIKDYLEIRTKGIEELTGEGNGTPGGLKMALLDGDKNICAYIWMRPSGTEPVLRILADVKGNEVELHDSLLDWQRSMILKAAEGL